LPFGTLAATPRDRAGGGNFGFDGCEGGAFVRAVAKRLRFGLSTGTPKIGAWFHFLDKWLFLGNSWFAHVFFLAAGDGSGK
jgi:hypothetical protein